MAGSDNDGTGSIPYRQIDPLDGVDHPQTSVVEYRIFKGLMQKWRPLPIAIFSPESFPFDCSEHIQVIEIQCEKNILQQRCRRPVRHISNLMFLLRNIPENSKPKFQCLSMTFRFQAEEISSAPADIDRRLRR